jgi:asparagine synthase (glutamine-hydrolysing)
MCGLIASVSPQRSIRSTELHQMLKLASHRGPDGLGTVFSEGNSWEDYETDSAWIGMGHVRLSIIDLSDGSKQPLISRCGRYGLVFNGEIYNYLELRTELKDHGRVFESDGDSEVLLQALVEWGVDALPKLRGMFAFVFVDLYEQEVTAARDRYGIKPLYLWRVGSEFHFASEIKQFLGHPKWKSKLNQKSALEFLLYGVTDYSASTHFADVEHIPPGSVAIVGRNTDFNMRISKWWNPDRSAFKGTYADACEQYQHLLRKSLELHLRSDVPIASCLSGGLDSSAIVGATSKWFDRDKSSHHTFTATSDDSRIDETRFARAVNEFSGSTGHELLPTSERLWSDLNRIIWHQDEPFGSTSIFAQWCVFGAMAEHGIKVALDGQGADEQLGGYDSFVSLYVLNQMTSGHGIRAVNEFRNFKESGRVTGKSVLSALAYMHLPKTVRNAVGRIAQIPSQNAGKWLNPHAISHAGVQDPFTPLGKYPDSVNHLSRDMVDRINLPMLLRFEDRNSMAFGIEARVPFVDHELMEFGLSIPEEFLLREGNTKSVLRDSVADCLPHSIVRRRDKIGFQTAESNWLMSQSSQMMKDFDDLHERAEPLLTSSTRDFVLRSLTGDASSHQAGWRMFAFLKWMKIFDVN